MKYNIPQKKRKKIQEERARQILIKLFPEKYSTSELSESPDIIDNVHNVGVEITSSLKTEIQQDLSRVVNLCGKTESEFDKNDKKNIEEGKLIAVQLPNGQYSAATNARWGDEHDFQTIYENKLDKLNRKHFKVFKENNLFIDASMIDKEELSDGITYFQIVNREINSEKRRFDIVYIFVEYALVEINMHTGVYKDYEVLHSDLKEISKTAFETVMGMSLDKFRGC